MITGSPSTFVLAVYRTYVNLFDDFIYDSAGVLFIYQLIKTGRQQLDLVLDV